MNAEALRRSEMVTLLPTTAQESCRRRSRGDVSLLHLIYQGCAIVGLVLGSYFFFSHFVVQSVYVSGSSMLPTLRDADYYLVNRFTCLFRAPHHGDIVVLNDPTDQVQAVKRVIGTAGDTIELRDGGVYRNGCRLEEPYLSRGTQTYPFDSITQVVHCGKGQFFVLGDNRFHSNDSRSYGVVSRSAILGLVVR